MDAAVLSSIHGHGLEMLFQLLAEPGASAPFIPPLAQSIAARRNDTELSGALKLVAAAKPETQAAVLDALTKGRKNAPRKPLSDKSARATLATLRSSSDSRIGDAARALEATFVATTVEGETAVSSNQLPPVEEVSDELFRKFVAALSSPRDLKHGHELFLVACATCHKIGNEGNEAGPDLLGQIGMAEESLLKDVLMPSERIRPGYETTVVQTKDGGTVAGILRNDGATSVTLIQPGGIEQVLLRKDVADVRRLATSLMPSFAKTLSPADLADVLAWLRSNLGPRARAARIDSGKSSSDLALPPPRNPLQ